MSTNPLEKYFRQPKFFISLPSKGAYSEPGTIVGDVTNLPVYGMTGMDEIIAKTPDSLLSGESSVSIIQSCIPSITNPWQMSMLDADLLFTATKIATWGNTMEVSHTCRKCQHENEYELDLSIIIDHYETCKFDNKVIFNDLIIKLKPLTYKQFTEFNLDNFKLQQQLAYAEQIKDQNEKQELVNQLWKDLAISQNKILVASIDGVETPDMTVSERGFIIEWLENCDKKITDQIKAQLTKNREQWAIPLFPVKCNECEHESNLSLDLDYSSFFGKA